jgi:hypothetical protein
VNEDIWLENRHWHRFLTDFVEYTGICEFEAIFEKALTRESGAQMGLFDEKKPEVENIVNRGL